MTTRPRLAHLVSRPTRYVPAVEHTQGTAALQRTIRAARAAYPNPTRMRVEPQK